MHIEIVPMILGFIAGLLINEFLFSSRRRKKKNEPKDPSVCSCGHPYSMHMKDGKCAVAIPTDRFDSRGNVVGKDFTTSCACHRYDGVPPAHLYLKED